jgi:hypothetical protein
VGRSFDGCLLNRLFLCGYTMRFTIRLFGCPLTQALYWELYRRISSLTVGESRSLWKTVFGTYQGASTIMRKALDWIDDVCSVEFCNNRLIMNWKRKWRKLTEEVSRYLPGGTLGSHDKRNTGWPTVRFKHFPNTGEHGCSYTRQFLNFVSYSTDARTHFESNNYLLNALLWSNSCLLL